MMSRMEKIRVNKSERAGYRGTRDFGGLKLRAVAEVEGGWEFSLKRVSSDFPYDAFGVREILKHDSLDNIDLSRLQDGAVHMLESHGGRVFGTVLPGSARVEDGALRVKVKIADDGGLGTEVARQWLAGVGLSLSIGYEYVSYRILEKDEDAGVSVRTFEVDKWRLLEISRVGVPADPSAKARGSATTATNVSEGGNMSEQTKEPVETRDKKDDVDVKPPVVEVRDASPPKAVDVTDADELRDSADARAEQLVARHMSQHDDAAKAKARAEVVAEIRKTAGELPSYGKKKKREAIDAMDKSVFDVLLRHAMPDTAPTGALPDPSDEGGVDEHLRANNTAYGRERQFEADAKIRLGATDSLAALLKKRGGFEDKDSKRQLAAQEEFQQDFILRCDGALAAKFRSAMSGGGVFISHRELAEYNRARAMQRAQVADASENKGDELISTDVRKDLYVEALYGSAMLTEAGMRTEMGLSSNASIPTQTAGISANFRTEVAAIAATDFGIGNIDLTPHRIGVAVDVSFQIQIQSKGFIDAIVRQQMLAALEEDIEDACLNGNGTAPNPRGIRNWSGVQTLAHGTNGANPSWKSTLRYGTLIQNMNIRPDGGMYSFLTTPELEALRRSTPRGGTGGDMPIWSDARDGRGYRTFVATLLPRNLTKGSGTNLHGEVVGKFSDSIMVMFGTPFVTVDPYTKAREGQEAITIQSFMDCAVMRPNSFVVSNDVSAA